MNHDTSRSAIENGPACSDCAAFDDNAGDSCSARKGHGGGEDWRREWHDCPTCDGEGIV